VFIGSGSVLVEGGKVFLTFWRTDTDSFCVTGNCFLVLMAFEVFIPLVLCDLCPFQRVRYLKTMQKIKYVFLCAN